MLIVACDGGAPAEERSSSDTGAAAFQIEAADEPQVSLLFELDSEIVLPELLSDRAWWSNQRVVISLDLSTDIECHVVDVAARDVQPGSSDLAKEIARFLVERVQAGQISGVKRSTNCGGTEVRRVTFDFSRHLRDGTEPSDRANGTMPSGRF